MDLLSPASAFRFPMPGGDCQSLQRHRSTSTPNVHMVSTVGPTGINIIEVSFGFWFVLTKQQTHKSYENWLVLSPLNYFLEAVAPITLGSNFLWPRCATAGSLLHYLNHKLNMLLLLNPTMPLSQIFKKKYFMYVVIFVHQRFILPFAIQFRAGSRMHMTFSHRRHIESVNQ